MDIITSAMQKNLHICADEAIINQTWQQFDRDCLGKKVFIYGAGNALTYLLRNIDIKGTIEAIIDNNPNRHTSILGWSNVDAWGTCYEKVPVVGIECLEKYRSEDIVVLIASTNFYQGMIEDLKQYGVVHYYVMLMMEINRRKVIFPDKDNIYDYKIERDKFIEYCCNIDIKPNKIVMSYGEYGGHAKYITRQLLKYNKDLDIVWLVHEYNIEVPNGVRIAPIRNWKSYIYELETAKIWLFDITVYDYIIKRPEQIYIQTKHWSSITLKKFYFDDKSSCKTKHDEEWIKYNGKIIDYMFVGSDFDIRTSSSGFCYSGENIRIGSSRTDALFDASLKEAVYKKYNLNPKSNVIIYAPTFRQTQAVWDKKFLIDIDFEQLRESVKNRFGGEWYVFVRLHPLLKIEDSIFKESDYIIDVGGYGDSQELVAASDIMVTDYSSIMFEPAFVNKPVFLYAPDRHEYINSQRELLIDYDTLPFSITETMEELKYAIQDFDKERYVQKIRSFFDYYGVSEDGHASERAAEFILKLLQ